MNDQSLVEGNYFQVKLRSKVAFQAFQNKFYDRCDISFQKILHWHYLDLLLTCIGPMFSLRSENKRKTSVFRPF